MLIDSCSSRSQEVVLNQVRDALATILQFREAMVRISV